MEEGGWMKLDQIFFFSFFTNITTLTTLLVYHIKSQFIEKFVT